MHLIFINNFNKFYNQLLLSFNKNLLFFLCALPKFNTKNSFKFSLIYTDFLNMWGGGGVKDLVLAN